MIMVARNFFEVLISYKKFSMTVLQVARKSIGERVNMNTENRWLVNVAHNHNSLVVVARQRFCKRWDTPTTINIPAVFTRMLVKGTSGCMQCP